MNRKTKCATQQKLNGITIVGNTIIISGFKELKKDIFYPHSKFPVGGQEAGFNTTGTPVYSLTAMLPSG